MNKMSTTDIDEFRRRIKATRDALLEFENYMDTWAETEKKKKNATPPKMQE